MTETAKILTQFGEYMTPGPDEEVVGILCDLLEKAQRGEVVAIAIGAIRGDGYVMTRANRGKRGTGELLGAVAALQSEMIENWRTR
jgi:hypothetical protein